MGRGARGHARAPRLGAARRRRAPARRAPAARRSAALDRRGRAGDAHVPTPHAALAADPPGCQRRRRGVPAAPAVARDGDRLHGEQSAARARRRVRPRLRSAAAAAGPVQHRARVGRSGAGVRRAPARGLDDTRHRLARLPRSRPDRHHLGLPVPPEGAFLLQGVIGFGVALPSSPGFVGVFEAATRVTLAIYGIDATRAVSYAVAYHLSTFVPITLLGLYSLSRLRLHLAEL